MRTLYPKYHCNANDYKDCSDRALDKRGYLLILGIIFVNFP